MTENFVLQLARLCFESYYYRHGDGANECFSRPQCLQCLDNGYLHQRFHHVSALLQHLENTECGKTVLEKPGMRKFLDVVVDDISK
jgi:hypothetical protein